MAVLAFLWENSFDAHLFVTATICAVVVVTWYYLSGESVNFMDLVAGLAVTVFLTGEATAAKADCVQLVGWLSFELTFYGNQQRTMRDGLF